MAEYRECYGCKKPYPVVSTFEKISIKWDLNHGTTKETNFYEFCPKCQMAIKELLYELGKKE